MFKIIFSEITINEELRARFQQVLLEPMLSMANAALQQWADQGKIAPLNIELTVRAISGMILGLLLQQSMNDQTLTEHWEELPGVLSRLLLDSIKKEQS
jgi:hypothetical protein